MTVGRIPSIEGGIQPTLLTTAGDTLYASSASNPARLGIGTAGQVLTVNSGATAPEWVTPSSGGMTLISTTTLTGASVTLSSIPATYINLKLFIVNFLPATDGSRMLLRMNSDSGANRHTIGSGAFGATSFDFFENADNAVTQGFCAIDFQYYANTTTWKTAQLFGIVNNSTTSTNVIKFTGEGIYNQTSAISSLQLFPNSGNFTSGTALLYGVK